jgi:hypothetical protein
MCEISSSKLPSCLVLPLWCLLCLLNFSNDYFLLGTGRVQVTPTPRVVGKKGGSKGKGKGPAKKNKVPVYMFSLRIADESGTADVICFDKHAQCFLGGTPAASFQKQESLRRAVADALEQCICSGLHIDMNLWSYRLPLQAGAMGRKGPQYTG